MLDQGAGNIATKAPLEAILRNLEDAAFVIDPESRTICACNPAAERMFGYPPCELIGGSTEPLHVDRRHHRRFAAEGDHHLKRDGVYRRRFNMRRRGGAVFPTTHTVFLARDAVGGNLAVSIVRDDSDASLIEQRDRLVAGIGETIRDASSLALAQRGMLAMLCRHFDWAAGEVWMMGDDDRLQRTVRRDGTAPADSAPGADVVERVWYGNRPEWLEDGTRIGDAGETGTLLAVPMSVGHPYGMVFVFASPCPRPRNWAVQVVTEYVCALAASRLLDLARRESASESDNRFRALCMAHPLPLWLVEPGSLAILEANEAAVDLLGYGHRAFRMHTLTDLCTDESQDSLAAQLEGALRAGGATRDLSLRARDGGLFRVRLHPYRIRWNGRDGIALAAARQSRSRETRLALDWRQLQEVGKALASLSPRERQVLDRLVEGRLTKEIAHELGLSPRTIEDYRASLKRKMGARTTAAAVRLVTAFRHQGQAAPGEPA